MEKSPILYKLDTYGMGQRIKRRPDDANLSFIHAAKSAPIFPGTIHTLRLEASSMNLYCQHAKNKATLLRKNFIGGFFSANGANK